MTYRTVKMKDGTIKIVKEYAIKFPLGIGGALTLLFIALKLTEQIEWSWVWVVSPLWIPYAFFASIIALYFVILIVCVVLGAILSAL